MQQFLTYTPKTKEDKSLLKPLLTFFAKLLLVMTLAFLVIIMNVFKSAASKYTIHSSFNIMHNNTAEKANNDIHPLAP